jgi:hypothetical protein
VMKFIKSNSGKVVLFILIMALLILEIIKRSGFCAAQMRFISDEEYIEMMLDYPYKHRLKLTHADTSVKTYIKNHPSCCKIKTTSTFDLLDMSARKVYINYPVKKEAIEDMGGAKYYEEYLHISSCGKVFNESTGMGEDHPFANNY